MAETWIDTRNGELLIGREAAVERIDEAGPDVVPLVELLEAKEFPFEAGDFGEVKRHTWGRDELLAVGKWVVNLYANAEMPQETEALMTSEHMRRLRVLRLFPEEKVVRRHFDKMWNYREEIGLEAGFIQGRYDDWSPFNYVEYARSLAKKLGRKPTREDYQEADGPSPRRIKEHVGGVRELNWLIGYPDVHDMDEEDMVLWGVQAFEANPHLPFTSRLVNALSRRKQGPSAKTVCTRFTYFSDFFSRVQKKHEEMEKEKLAANEEKLLEFSRLKERGLLPEEILALPEGKKMSFVAKYWVARRCLSGYSEENYINMASIPSIISAIRTHHPEISAGYIETTASMLGVFDDIWRLSDHKKQFRVSPEELNQKARSKQPNS